MKIIFAVTGVFIFTIIISGAWYFYNFEKYAPKSYVGNTSNNASTTPQKINMSEVLVNNTATKCYSVISGSVYDLTMWVNLHPGGKKTILSICGIDGTEKFIKKHRGGEKFMKILDRYKIGTLTQ